LSPSGDPVDRGAAIVRTAEYLRIVDDDMLIIEHEFHVQIRIPVEPDAVRRLLATAIPRASGRNARRV